MIYASLLLFVTLWEVIKRKIYQPLFGVELDGNICHWPHIKRSAVEGGWMPGLFVWVLFFITRQIISLQAVDRANFEGPRGRMIFDHSGTET